MRRRLLSLSVIALTLFGPIQSAHALCIYRGELYGKSTITGEFRESSLVVRGVVIETHDIVPTDGDDSEGFNLAVARIRVDKVLKGAAGDEVLLISRRNSGGFYVEPGVEYLLFLRPSVRAGWSKGYDPDEVAKLQDLPRPRFINYGCGQSVPWSDVSAEKRRVLDFEVRRQRQ